MKIVVSGDRSHWLVRLARRLKFKFVPVSLWDGYPLHVFLRRNRTIRHR